MTYEKKSHSLENKLWGYAIRIMKEDGLLFRGIKWISTVSHSRAGFYALCVLVWAAVGFLLGLVLGKIYWFIQFY